MTEWPASEKAHLQGLAARRAVAVAYTGCDLTIIDGCKVDASYGWQQTTLTTDTVEITDGDQLWARLPLGAAALEGELRRTGRLAVRTTVAGQLRVVDFDPKSVPADSACAAATHVITAISIGSFKLLSGGGAASGGGVSVAGVGAGSRSTHDESVVREAGDPDRCKDATPEKPDLNCSSPIQVFLTPLVRNKTSPFGTAVVLHGQNADGAYLRSAELFDTGANRWSPMPDDPLDRACGAQALRMQDGRILVIGGSKTCADDSTATNQIRWLDVANRTWSSPTCQTPCIRLAGGGTFVRATESSWAPKECEPSGPCPSYGRCRFAATALADGRAFIFGGCAGGCNGPNELGQTVAGAFELARIGEILDPRTGRWTQTPTASTPRRTGGIAVVTGAGVLVCGGADGFREVHRSCERYDLNSGFNGAAPWTAAGETPEPVQAMAAMPDGRVIALIASHPERAWIWSADSWTAGPEFPTPRDSPSLVRTSDGHVMVIGGTRGKLAVGDVDVFEPRENRWRSVSPMHVSRFGQAVAALDDGRVLVAGGCQGGASAKAEMYDPAAAAWKEVPDMAQARCGALGVGSR